MRTDRHSAQRARWTGRRTRWRGERGVSAVLVALVFGSLMIVAAFGVDIGQAYAERRHDQNTVDAAAMSGMVEAALGGGEIKDVVLEVQSKVNTTLGRVVTDPEWEACTDPEQLELTTRELQAGNPVITPVSDCISFSAGFDRLRVRVPSQEVEGVFGPMLGFANINTYAAAEAEVVPNRGGGSPPFVAFEGTTKGDFICLRTSASQDPEEFLMTGNGPGTAPSPGNTAIDPCHSNAGTPLHSSAFGTINPWAYEDGCQKGNDQIEKAIAVGIDHLLGVFDGGFDSASDPDPMGVVGDGYDSRTREDGAVNCTTAFPNTLLSDTGYTDKMLRCGLVSESNRDLCQNEFPRLQDPTVQTDYLIVEEKFDNVPPWTYLLDAADLHLANVPDACVILAASRSSDGFDLDAHSRYDAYTTAFSDHDAGDYDHYDRYDLLIECLQVWDAGNGTPGTADDELFAEDLGGALRFAFIPQVHETTISSAQQKLHIEGFLPVYMYRLYVKTNNSLMCDPLDPRTTSKYWVHDAGQTVSRYTKNGKYICGAKNDALQRMSAVVFACGMVPDTLCDKDTSLPVTSGQDIYDFRLAK